MQIEIAGATRRTESFSVFANGCAVVAQGRRVIAPIVFLLKLFVCMCVCVSWSWNVVRVLQKING